MTMRTGSAATSSGPLRRAVENAGEEDIRRFLLEELASDERMAARFVARYGGLDVKGLKKALKSELSAIKREYSSGAFIDWRSSLDFESEYCSAISSYLDPVVAKRDADAIFELLEAALASFRTVHIDDSNGFAATAFDMMKRYWGKVLLYTPRAQVPERVIYLSELADKVDSSTREGDFDWFVAEELRALPVDFCAGDPDLAPLAIGLIDKRMAQLHDQVARERAEEERRRANAPA